MGFGLPLLSSHIARHVLGGIALVLLVFLALSALFTLIEELGEDEAGYSAATALQYTLYTLPHTATSHRRVAATRL